MPTDKELMQQALEALESEHPEIQLRAAIALRERLAQPEQTCEELGYVPLSADGKSVYIDGVGLVPLAQPEQPKQEPVGRLESDPYEGHVFVPRIDGDWSMLGEDLYTAPPQRKPLTDEEIEACRQQGFAHRGLTASFDFVKAARAVEAKLKENT